MARQFNGTSDKIVAGINPNYAQFSVSAWVNWPSSGSANPRIVSNDHTDVSNNGFQLFVAGTPPATGQNITFDIGNGTTVAAGTTGTVITIGAGVWNHVAGTYDGSTVKVYWNGAVGANTGSITGSMAAGANNLQIGLDTFGASAGVTGNIADVAIWNTGLTSGNITSLFNGVRPVVVNSANLQGWWPIDGFASPETDLSSNGNNGTVTGTTGKIVGPPALWRVSL